MASSCLVTQFDSRWHTFDQGSGVFGRYIAEQLVEHLDELGFVSKMMFSKLPNEPQIFEAVEIRTVGWPLENRQAHVAQPGFGFTSRIAWCTVLLVDDLLSFFAQNIVRRLETVFQNLDVSVSVQPFLAAKSNPC